MVDDDARGKRMATKRRQFGQITKMRSGRYQARYVGPDGKLHTSPVGTYQRKSDAEAWLNAERRLIELESWSPPTVRAVRDSARYTLAEYARVVLKRRTTRAKPLKSTTVDNYQKLLRLAILPTLGAMPLDAITPAVINQWYDGLPAANRSQNGSAYNLLASIMSDAEKEELIERTPCRLKGAGKPKPERVPEALTMDELGAYFAAVPERRRPLVVLAVLCGLRSGEVRGLRRQDLDLTTGVVRVRQAVSRVYGDSHTRQWLVTTPKTRAGVRDVAIPAVGVAYLRDWLTSQPVRGRDALLFPASDGVTPLNDSVVREAHKKGAAAVGRPSLTVHDLRRTAVTLASQMGATVRESMTMLGHTTATVAMAYQVPTAERDKERADRLDAALSSAGVKLVGT